MKRDIITILISVLFLGACSKSNQDITPVKGNFTYGSFTDERDNNTYKTIKVGNQEWMIENLKYRMKFGSLDGCLSYGEADFDTTKVVINKADFKKQVLKIYPGVLSFTNAFFWVWNTIDGQFINSRGGYYKQSWSKFRTEMIAPYYGTEIYAPFIKDLDIIAANLYEVELIPALKQMVNADYVKKYGYLYKFSALSHISPEGWRVPSDDDFKTLEKGLGLNGAKIDVLEDWRDMKSVFIDNIYEYNNYGGTKIFGINNQRADFRNLNFKGYYWTTTEVETGSDYNLGIIRAFQLSRNSIYRGTNTLVKVANSVICVRDL